MKLDKLKSWYNSTSLLAWSLTAFILLVFLFFPSQVLLANLEFWNYDLLQLLPYVLVGIVLSGLTLLLLRKKQSYWLSFVFISVFWIVLLSDILAPIALPPLDGTVTTSTEPFDSTLIEILIVILVISVVYGLRKKLVVLARFSLVLVVVFTLINWVQIILANPTQLADESQQESNQVKLPNIYHIVLDEMQTEVAKQIIAQEEMESDLLGFTFFEDNLANYPYTHASLPSYMTSTFFDVSQKYEDWQYSFSEKGLAPWLESKGYVQWQYAAEARWIPDQTTHTTHLYEVKDKYLGNMFKQTRFASLLLARILPTTLTNESLGITSQLRETLFDETKVAQLGDENVAPYISLLMFDKLKQEELTRPTFNQYVYMHAALPHLPYILDENCQIRTSPPGRTALEYVDQSKCALNQTIEFLNVLKKQGKYDNSLIVVHSDHGDGHHGFITIKDGEISTTKENRSDFVANSNRTEEWLDARSYSLLMIKPPGETDELQISSTPTQLVDLYPTIVDLVSDDKIEAEGESVFTIDAQTDRSIQRFFWPSPGEPSGDIYKFEFNQGQLSLESIGSIRLTPDLFR